MATSSQHPAKVALLALLSKVASPCGLTATAVRELASRARIAECSAGRTICVSADREDFVNFVVKGTVYLDLVPRDGKAVALKLIGDGEFFCLPPAPRSGAYHVRAVASEPSMVALWGRASIACILGMLPTSGSIQLLTTSWLALSRVAEEKCMLLSLPLRRRLQFVLTRLARRFGKPMARGILVDVSLSDEQLGHVVHASRSSVNRELMALRRAGVIERAGDRILIAQGNLRRPADRPLRSSVTPPTAEREGAGGGSTEGGHGRAQACQRRPSRA